MVKLQLRFWILVLLTGMSSLAFAEEVKVICPSAKELPKIPKLKRNEVYADSPFKAGEVSEYEMSYMGALAGHGTLEIKPPIMHDGNWHRNFHAEAKTGDWYKMIFVGHDNIDAISRPWDFGIAKFYMDQDEGKLFGRRFRQKKWLDFEHEKCKVKERVWNPDKKEESGEFDLLYGAMDSLGVIFFLRTVEYKLNRIKRAPVYTSQKNWWLEAKPVAFETVEVPAGKFQAVKLKLQTFIGKELQQKGDVHAWIATDVPQRPVVMIQGEIKIGSVWLKLSKFKPGK